MDGELSMSMQMTQTMENIRRAPPPCTYRDAVYNCADRDYAQPIADPKTRYCEHLKTKITL